MIFEQKFTFQKKQNEIFELLFQEGEGPLEIEKEISMIYIGDKNNVMIKEIKNILKNNELLNDNNLNINYIQEQFKDKNENKNIFFLIKYKDIYIGGVSLNFDLREGFGLNKYENSSSFYIGQWKNNMKEGIGFLKIDDNTLYVGSFHLNQFEGFGMVYYKSRDSFYFGEFENGSFKEGIYCDINKKLFYRGKFNQNKKNDSFCTFLEKNNRQLFIGEVNDDIFLKGYLCLFQMNEIVRKDENGEDEFVANFDIDKIFYFDKANDKNISFIHGNEFENEFSNKIQENMKKIFEVDYRMEHKMNYIIDYFNYLESLVNDEFYNILEKYNENNEQSLEKFFLDNYNFVLNQFQEVQEEMDINEIRKEIEIPEINKENIN